MIRKIEKRGEKKRKGKTRKESLEKVKYLLESRW